MQMRVPTRKEFEEMAARGRLHKDDSFIPSDSDLDDAQSPLELGRLYGFSEDDIARFYAFLGASMPSRTVNMFEISSTQRCSLLSPNPPLRPEVGNCSR